MKTDDSPFGNIEKTKNNPLISQNEFVLSGFTHTSDFNNNDTNCMNNLTINNKRKVDFPRLRSSKKSYYSSKGLRILMILGLLLFSISMFGQGYYLDEFSSSNYSNNDGTLNFGGDWIEVSDNSNAGSGRIEITGGRLIFPKLRW